MAGAEINCTAISKTFGAAQAVAPMTFKLEAGQTTALVGPSGCGKSTVLRMIAGLEAPTTGDITLGGEEPVSMAKRGALAMAFQDPSLLPWRTVRANIALGAELAGKPSDGVDTLIDLVGLGGFADYRPAELSGGMRQRAAIARSLISAPEVLLLDEPFGAVDAMTRRRLNIDLPAIWRDRSTTVVLVTHSVEEAIFLSDRVLVLSQRPAKVIADIDVEVTGPRNAQLAETSGFAEAMRSVFSALERDAMP